MSRKTRKLIWSAPLVAVLAVAGVLALFVALEPGSVFANPLPAAPSNLEAEPAAGDAGRTTLVLTWTAPAGGNVTGYRIDQSDNRFVWETLVGADNPHTGTTYTDSMLTADDTRWYRVFAVSDHGVSPVSNLNSGTTNEKGVPGSVRNLRAAANGRDQIDLSWDPPADNGGEAIIGYEIQYHNGEDWKAFDVEVSVVGTTTKVKADDPTYEDNDAAAAADDALDLDPGETRKYRVRAVSGPQRFPAATDTDLVEGEHVSKDWVRVDGKTQNAAAPGRVTGLTAVNTGTADTQITLYWYAPEDNGGWPITDYLIQVQRQDQRWSAMPNAAALKAGAQAPTNPILGMLTPVDNTKKVNRYIEAPGPGVSQVMFSDIEPVDHDGDTDREDGGDSTPTKQVRWEFRVFALTTDDGNDNIGGPDDTNNNVNDDVVRVSPSPSKTAYATPGTRLTFDHDEDSDSIDNDATPLVDPLPPPDVTVTGTGGSVSDAGALKEKIELGIVVDATAALDDQFAYRIDYSDDLGVTWKLLERDTSLTNFVGAGRVYADSKDLGYDQRRTYRVFAVGNDWRRDVGPSTVDPITGWTDASGPPGKVTDVMASAPDLETIQVSWSAPEEDGGQPITNYRYRYVMDDDDDVADSGDWRSGVTARPIGSNSTGNANLMATIKVKDDLPAILPTLTKDAIYYIQIAAANENPLMDDVERPAVAGEDWSVAAEFTTGEPTVPDAVEGLLSQAAVDTSGDVTGVLLIWNQPSSGADVTKYVVELKDSDGEWVSPTDDADDVMNRTSYTDPDDEFEMDEMRVYRVAAQNGAGKGLWTEVYYPRDPAADHAHGTTKPTNVGASSDTAGELMLTWEGGANADSFLLIAVNMEDTSDYGTMTISDGAAQMGTVTGLTSGVDYLGIVVALQGTGADQTFTYGASGVQAVQ